MAEQSRLMIAGLGSIGQRHLRNALQLGVDDVILFRTGLGALPDDEFSHITSETELEKALANSPDGVVISNPSALHLDVAIPAAEMGCSLLIEKPLSNDMERVPALKVALEKGGGKVLIGFQFRFHPGLETIRKLLNDGEIGRFVSARVHWGEYLPDWHPWEDYRQSYSARADLGGGVVLTLCHPFDYLRWIFGEVESVSATIDRLGDLEIEVEDTAEVTLRFAQGGFASVHLDYLQRSPSHSFSIVGTEGRLEWDNADGAVDHFDIASDEWKRYDAPEGFERNDLFLKEMQHFLAVVRGEEIPSCDLTDGIRALEIALAALQSAKEDRVVELSHGSK